MRYSCNKRLANAYFYWAQGSLKDPHCRQHYKRLRERGHNHARALRGVADRLLRILVAMLRDRTLYDPERPTPRLGMTNGARTVDALSIS